MSRYILIISLLLVHILNGMTFESKDDLKIYLYAPQFKGVNDSTIIELTYSLDLSYSKYISVGEPDKSQELEIIVKANNGKMILDKKIDIADYIYNNNTFYLAMDRINTVQDTLLIYMSFTDKVIEKNSIIDVALPVKKFDDKLSISDLVFIKKIVKGENKTKFYKGGLNLIPYTVKNINTKTAQKKLYVYYQVNNLSYSDGNPTWYTHHYEITDHNDNIIESSKQDSVRSTAFDATRIEIVGIEDIEIGEYNLTILINDLSTGENISQSRHFTLSDVELGINELIPMEKSDIKKYLKQIKYIATNEEKKIFKKLSKEGKQQFIINFWNRRDPDPSTDKNEFFIEHFNRLEYCESHFRGGVDSDMARIFILYGTPVEVDRDFSNTYANKPIEKWYYAITGVKEFIFVDRLEDGEYKLVHSTHEDEIQNPNWQYDYK